MAEIDLIVGIPSFNNEKTISFVVRQVDAGLKKYFPEKRALIIDSDGKSNDGTKRAFEEIETKTEKEFVYYKNPLPGKGSAFKEIFEIALERNAKAVVCVDSDLRSISPEWMKIMIEPILQGNDLTAPYYSRYKYDATITNHICYPLTYSLLCRNLRQPIGGDFAFSRKFAEFCLNKGVWRTNVAKFGIDIFLTSSALLNDFRVKQAFLGAKIHDSREPTALKPMFEQVVNTFFSIINENKEKWVKGKKVKEIELIGKGERAEPESFRVDSGKMKQDFLIGKREHGRNWNEILGKDNFALLIEMDEPKINAELWSKIVYDFIAANKKIDALIPIWSARNYSFVQETKELGNEEAEKKILEQAEIFYENRGYLIEKMWGKNG